MIVGQFYYFCTPETDIYKPALQELIAKFNASKPQPDLPEGMLLDALNAVVLIADERGEIIYANQATEKIYGLQREEVMGDGWWKLTSTDDQEAERRQKNMISLAKGEKSLSTYNLLERPFKRKDNKTIWTQWTNSRISKNRVIGIAQDITEKKVLEDRLQHKIRDNELLLQEVYHRVNNNLQIILSLLKLEFEGVADPISLNALNKTNARIRAMSIIHHELCNLKIAEDFSLKRYVKSLLHQVFKLYKNRAEVDIRIKVLASEIDTSSTVNLGLLLVEIVSNSLKHAFTGRKTGTIWVDLGSIDHENYHHRISVRDNGIGLQDTVDLTRPKSLGFEIVNSLTEQINGKLELKSSEKGTLVTVKF